MVIKILRGFLKVLLWIVGCIFGLLLLIFIALELPPVQKFLGKKATAYMSQKTGTRFEVGRVDISLPVGVALRDVYVEDRQKDTLLAGNELEVRINPLGLLDNEIMITSVSAEGITAHIKRSMPDSSFNFDFIAKAFAADTSAARTPKDTAAAPAWKIGMKAVALDNVYFTFYDETAGTDAIVRLGSFSSDVDIFDLEKMRFRVNDVELSESYASVTQNFKTKSKTPKEDSPLQLIIGDALIEGVKLDYHDKVNGQRFIADVGRSEMHEQHIDVMKQYLAVESVKLYDTKAFIEMGTASPEDSLVAEIKEEGTPADKAEWLVQVKKIDLQRNTVRYHKTDAGSVPQGTIDYNDMLLTNVGVRIDNFDMKGEQLKADIKNVTAHDKSGIELKKLATKLTYNSKGIELAGLDLRTGNSRVSNYIKVTYPSIEALSKDPGSIRINAVFNNTSIAFADLLRLDTALAKQPSIAKNGNTSVRLDGNIKGQLKDLAINNLKVNTRYSTFVHVNGTIKGLPDMNRTVLALDIPKLTTSASDIRAFAPDSALPPSITLPPLINMSGSFNGTLVKFEAKSDLKTSFGNASLSIATDTIDKKMLYKGNAQVHAFNIGKLLNQEKMLGPVTGNVNYDGAGTKVEEMELIVTGKFDAIRANGYTYSNLNLYSVIKDTVLRSNVMIRDSNLALALDGRIQLAKDRPAYDIGIFLEGADLKDLNFTKDNIKVQAVAEADLQGSDINSMNGEIGLRNVLVIKDDKRLALDSMMYVSIDTRDKTKLKVRSSIVSADINGDIRLTDIPTALMGHFNNYFDVAKAAPDTVKPNQNFEFDIRIRNASMITEVFMPELQISPGTITGRFDRDKQQLYIDADLPRISYAGNKVDSLKIWVDSNSESLKYDVSLSQLLGSQYKIKNASLAGNIQDNRMHSRMQIDGRDDIGKELLIAGGITTVDKVYRLNLDTFILNDGSWEIAKDNYIAFEKTGPYFHNVRMQSGESLLAINSTAATKFTVDMKAFDLGALAGIVAVDKPLVGGVASGKVDIDTRTKRPVFKSDLYVQNFSYMADTLGAVTLKADNIKEDRYNLDLSVKGRGNNILASGYYKPDAEREGLNLDVNASEINLETFEAFAGEQMKLMSGTAAANFKVTGTVSDPDVEGDILFRDVKVKPAFVNSLYSINNERVIIDRNGIYFNTFVLTDTLGNKAEVDGAIFTGNFRDYHFDLDVRTKNFLALNTSEKDNEMYYGRVFVDSRVSITGSNTKPEVEIFAKMNEGSAITFIIPEQVLTEIDRDGIVQFVDFHPDLNSIMAPENARSDTAVPLVTDIELTANVEIDEESEFRIVIDPRTGDSLFVRGSSTFSLGIDPSGKISLIGNYDIAEGSYQLSFGNIVRKRFVIQRGSRISWSGDPIGAMVDIKAQHRVRTSPVDLLTDQVVGLTDAERDRLSQQLQFLVTLNMTGRLLTPKIDFDITLPPDQRDALNGTVYTRLLQLNEQESELNQQVFALIILNRFLPQNPLEASGNSGSAAATAVRASTSKLLTQQLNQFTAEYIRFVDINLSLDSYQDQVAGQQQGRTNMQVDVRKEAFNDRLRVDMGGNVPIEGKEDVTVAGDDKKKSNDVAADVSVEYKLTPDGRYRVRGLRRTGYAGIFEGRVTETGVGVIFERDYTRFRDLFKKPEDEDTFKEIK